MMALGNATGLGKGKGGKGVRSSFRVDSSPASEDGLIREIYQQLQKEPFNKVWFDMGEWKQRFGAFAPTPKEFLLQRPDLFELTFEGKRFTCEWVGGEPPRQVAKKRLASAVSTSGPAL